QPLQVLLACFGLVGWRPARAEIVGLGVGVDVAELAAEADVHPRVAAGEMLRGLAPDALLGALLYWLGDRPTAAAGVEDPAACWRPCRSSWGRIQHRVHSTQPSSRR